MSNSLIEKDHSQIVKEMLVEFANELKTDSISSASDIAIRAKVYANQIEGFYYNQAFILKQTNPMTATGKYLDRWGKSLNVGERKKDTNSVGNVIMGRKAASDKDLTIKKGTMFSTDEEIYGKLITGITKEDTVLKAGELEVSILSETIEVGEYTNVPPGSFIVLNNPPTGIEFVRNDKYFKDGTNREDDETYRSRFEKEKFYGTDDAFAKRAREVDGVTFAKTLENNRGPGTTDILISTVSGIPSDELVAKTSTHVLAKRPLCCDLGVIKPNSQKVNIEINVELKENFTLETEIENITVLERIKQAIRTYFKVVGIDGVIRKMGVSDSVYSLDEVVDVEVISPIKNIHLDNSSIAEEGVFNVSV
ncbi:baseplate J/gp47 family protein [Tepidibacter hydrothermalis]|uniref:Baseplate J/gp47 family protein n=1 Tax=Tepidibacter hydrothermalis TaxID=3036126 RepID=A0ABY8EK31_9FIRM|nr:baseplate J/gp47 family protein [Tepidibacter hydrothermalis]WFD12449.1 baseplate J/gp47 family protein [Tepidibacter hydrothermalis]